MNGNILVTGGAGYIGSHICWKLKEAGYTPIVIDNLGSGHKQAVKFGPLAIGNIGDSHFIRDICNTYNPAGLMHLAAYIDVGESVSNPEKYNDNNFNNAKRLFSTILECGIRNIIFSSTAAVYGTPRNAAPITEDSDLAPINPYGESKLNCENFLQSLNDMNSVTLRYFNAAGAAPAGIGIGEAHSPETHVIPRALLSTLNSGADFRIFGTDYPTPDGTAIRDYVHVEDIAEAHILAFRMVMENGGKHIYNIGSGSGYSVRQIVEAISRQTGKPLPTQIAPRRAGDPAILLADTGKIRKKLKWEPRHGLHEIISSALEWHQSDFYNQLISAQKNHDKE